MFGGAIARVCFRPDRRLNVDSLPTGSAGTKLGGDWRHASLLTPMGAGQAKAMLARTLPGHLKSAALQIIQHGVGVGYFEGVGRAVVLEAGF